MNKVHVVSQLGIVVGIPPSEVYWEMKTVGIGFSYCQVTRYPHCVMFTWRLIQVADAIAQMGAAGDHEKFITAPKEKMGTLRTDKLGFKV